MAQGKIYAVRSAEEKNLPITEFSYVNVILSTLTK